MEEGKPIALIFIIGNNVSCETKKAAGIDFSRWNYIYQASAASADEHNDHRKHHER